MILLRQDASAGDGAASRRSCCGAPSALEFAPGAYVFPGGSVDARDADPASGGPGRTPAEFGRAARRAAGPRPGPWSAPRSGRRSRSPACCWPGRRTTTWSRDSAALAADRHALLDRVAPRSPRCSAAGAWCSAPTCSPRGPAGSRRRPRRAATTPGSSPPPCPRAGRHGGAGGSTRTRGIRVGGLAAARVGAGGGPGRPDDAAAADRGDPGRARRACRRIGHPGSPPGHHAAAAQADRRGRAGAAGAAAELGPARRGAARDRADAGHRRVPHAAGDLPAGAEPRRR